MKTIKGSYSENAHNVDKFGVFFCPTCDKRSMFGSDCKACRVEAGERDFSNREFNIDHGPPVSGHSPSKVFGQFVEGIECGR